jgi:hypothetical protein
MTSDARRSLTPRAILPALGALALLAACVVNLDFTYTVAGEPVQAVDATTTLSALLPVDFAGQSDIQAHKGSIDSLSLNALDLTVSAVQSDNTITTVTGTLALRPDGVTDASQDVLVGSLTNYAITVGSTVHLVGSPALDAFALNTVKGSGRFSCVINGSTTGGLTADFAIDVTLTMSMGYDSGL